MIDSRVVAGMKAQLGVRATRLAAGGRHLGWKAGFGAPAALDAFGLTGPLVGFMLQEARLASGNLVSIAGWTKPVAEPEIAIYLGADVADGCDPVAVAGAISGLGAAIELADVDRPPDDVTMILAGNIFHRRVILGRCDASRAGARLDGLIGRATRNGALGAAVTELEANTGRFIDVVGHMASTLAACGEPLREGDIIIAGSVIPPIFLTKEDDEVTFALDPIDEVSVRFLHF